MINRPLVVVSLTLMALLAIHPWFGPDIWYHLARAGQMLAQGTTMPVTPTVVSGANLSNQYWLYQLALAAAFTVGGVVAVTILFSSAWVAIGWIWMRLTRAPVLFPLFVVLAQMRLEYRPETFSFLFLSLMLLLIERPGGRGRACALIAIQILWVNVHGYFALGPALVAAAWLGRRRRWYGWVFGGVAVATLLNPDGPRAYESLWAMTKILRELDGLIEELTPTTRYAWWAWPMPAFWIYVAATSLGVLGFARRRPYEAMVAATGVALGVRAFRFMPVMLILTEPLIGAALARVRWPRAVRGAACGLVAVGIVAVVHGDFHRWTGSGTRFGTGLEWAEYPIGAAAYLDEVRFKGRLFNEPDDGGYFEYHLPYATIAADSSYVDASATRAYFAAAADPAAFAGFDQKFHFDAAVIRITNEAMITALLHAPVWAPVYADSHRIVFLKNAQAIDLTTAPHRRAGEDLRRPQYGDAAAAWFRLAERENDQRLLARLKHEFL